jgi:hypothetical protein
VILNGGAYTHTSVAIHDAIKGITVPVIEVHLSNPHKREEFRHKSYIGMAAMATIAGFGAGPIRWPSMPWRRCKSLFVHPAKAGCAAPALSRPAKTMRLPLARRFPRA